MIEWLVLPASIVGIFLVLILLWGSSEKNRGEAKERMESAEEDLPRVADAMEKLTSNPPDRAGLSQYWLRRIRKSEGKQGDTTLSDPNGGGTG